MTEKSQNQDELVTVATFRNPFDAQVLRMALGAEGIAAVCTGGAVGTFARQFSVPEAGAEVKVRLADRDSALEFIRRSSVHRGRE